MSTEAHRTQADPGDLNSIQANAPQVPATPTLAMLRTLGVIAMISGLLLAMA